MTVFSVPPVVQLWQSLCNSRPLPPHDWPCCHIQCGDYGKSLRAPPCFCVHPVWNIKTRQHNTHTRLTHSKKIKTRGCSSRWSLFKCLFINWFSFLSCYLAHPAGAEQHCKTKQNKKKQKTACGKWLRQLNVTPRKLTSCNINLTRVPPEMRMSDYCGVFFFFFFLPSTQTLHLYITNVHFPVHPTSLNSLQSELAHHLYFCFFSPHSAKPNLKGWSWIVNVCF